MRNVLFVCTGNICRSPMAEGLFRHAVKGRGDLLETLNSTVSPGPAERMSLYPVIVIMLCFYLEARR